MIENKVRYIVLACIFSITSSKLFAQGMFAGYADFCGVPVIVTQNPQIASASLDSFGNPVIYIDPSAMSNWTASRMFTIAHECAHHILGHSLPQGMWFRSMNFWATREQELAADCWAAQQLRAILGIQDLQRTIAQFSNQGPMPQGNYPSGLERASVVARCAGFQ